MRQVALLLGWLLCFSAVAADAPNTVFSVPPLAAAAADEIKTKPFRSFSIPSPRVNNVVHLRDSNPKVEGAVAALELLWNGKGANAFTWSKGALFYKDKEIQPVFTLEGLDKKEFAPTEDEQKKMQSIFLLGARPAFEGFEDLASFKAKMAFGFLKDGAALEEGEERRIRLLLRPFLSADSKKSETIFPTDTGEVEIREDGKVAKLTFKFYEVRDEKSNPLTADEEKTMAFKMSRHALRMNRYWNEKKIDEPKKIEFPMAMIPSVPTPKYIPDALEVSHTGPEFVKKKVPYFSTKLMTFLQKSHPKFAAMVELELKQATIVAKRVKSFRDDKLEWKHVSDLIRVRDGKIEIAEEGFDTLSEPVQAYIFFEGILTSFLRDKLAAHNLAAKLLDQQVNKKRESLDDGEMESLFVDISRTDDTIRITELVDAIQKQRAQLEKERLSALKNELKNAILLDFDVAIERAHEAFLESRAKDIEKTFGVKAAAGRALNADAAAELRAREKARKPN